MNKEKIQEIYMFKIRISITKGETDKEINILISKDG